MKKHAAWDIGGDWSLKDMVEAMERHGMPRAPEKRAPGQVIKQVLTTWASESGWIAATPITVLGLLTRWCLPEKGPSFALAHTLAREIGTEMGWEEHRFQTKPRHRFWCRPEARSEAEAIHSMLHEGYVCRVDSIDELRDCWYLVHQTAHEIESHINTLKDRIVKYFGEPGYLVVDDSSRCTICSSNHDRTAAVWTADVGDALRFEDPGGGLFVGAVYFVCIYCQEKATSDIEQAAVGKIRADLHDALGKTGDVWLEEVVA